MMNTLSRLFGFLALSAISVSAALADGPAETEVCGPQSPRDISLAGGSNPVAVPGGETPHLCNVHFHEPFEHQGFASVPAASASPGEPVCGSADNGDDVEFHWVYTNCTLPTPAVKGLANCVCDRSDMVLRVFAQTYRVDASGEPPTQPSEDLIRYAGSTTGASYDDKICSMAKVNWEVAAYTRKLDKAALGHWCESNEWIDEHHPHGSRAIVRSEQWLSPFTPQALDGR